MKSDRWQSIAKKLAVPLALAVITAVGVDHYLQQKTDALDQAARAELATRIVADRALTAGHWLTLDDLAVHDVPRAWLSSDVLSPDQVEAVVGKVLLRDLAAGEPLSRLVIADPQPPALGDQLAPGRRAMTLPVDHISSLSGRLAAGDVIDLFVTFPHDGQRITTLLTSAVRVLATDRALVASGVFEASAEQRQVTSVTVDVSPQQAVKLVAANAGGVLTAVLRVDGTSPSGPVSADHLPGFVGLAPSYAEARAPTIIYGDAADWAAEAP